MYTDEHTKFCEGIKEYIDEGRDPIFWIKTFNIVKNITHQYICKFNKTPYKPPEEFL